MGFRLLASRAARTLPPLEDKDLDTACGACYSVLIGGPGGQFPVVGGEVVMLGFKAQLAKINLTSVNIAGVDIAIKSDPVKNLGVMFDCGLKMTTQVANTAKSANFRLVNIGRARKMLTTDSTKLAVHTLVTSRLDYCNSLLAGINRGLLKRLQNVQRTAARLITRKRKYDPKTG